MRIAQAQFNGKDGWLIPGASTQNESVHDPDVVFVFGERSILCAPDFIYELQSRFPDAILFGCSTAGEIQNTRVFDASAVITAVALEHTRISHRSARLTSAGDSYALARRLAGELEHRDLTHALVLAEGVQMNGSALARGLRDGLPEHVTVTGGLSADGDQFVETVVFDGRAPQQNLVSILGFYGDRIRVGCGSQGGWDSFGPERLVTRSRENVLYELDGKSALDLYRTYLGEHATQLPASALLFPLSLRNVAEQKGGLVRTVLAIDETQECMIFAGDVPEGNYARLMMANIEHLIEGAQAAALSSKSLKGQETADSPDLALLVSCVGRKLIMKQRVEEEVEAVRSVLGPDTVLAGFYSYGELCPFSLPGISELHNQTMTVTTLSERP